jgi:hypothetical protein
MDDDDDDDGVWLALAGRTRTWPKHWQTDGRFGNAGGHWQPIHWLEMDGEGNQSRHASPENTRGRMKAIIWPRGAWNCTDL